MVRAPPGPAGQDLGGAVAHQLGHAGEYDVGGGVQQGAHAPVAVLSRQSGELGALGNIQRTVCGRPQQLGHSGHACHADGAGLTCLTGEEGCQLSRRPPRSSASANHDDRSSEPAAGRLQRLGGEGHIQMVSAEPGKRVSAGQHRLHPVPGWGPTGPADQLAEGDAEGQLEDAGAGHVATD